MRLCTFSADGTARLGAVVEGSVVDLAAAAHEHRPGSRRCRRSSRACRSRPRCRTVAENIVATVRDNLDPSWSWQTDAVTLHHPFRPRKNIVRAGGNTAPKAGEPPRVGVTLPPGRWLTGFPISVHESAERCARSGPADHLADEGHAAGLRRAAARDHHRCADELRGSDQALANVFGYAVATDVSALDLRLEHGQWPKAGSLDSSSRGARRSSPATTSRTRTLSRCVSSCNGETCIQGVTADALRSIGEMLSEISTGILLEPGDVFMLGTPERIGFGRSPEQWLAEGDTVTSTIEGMRARSRTRTADRVTDHLIGIDIGGSFTDIVASNLRTGDVRYAKTHTHPADLIRSLRDAMDAVGVPSDDVSVLRHGTTVVINADSHPSGSKTALLTTAGFRDVLEIGRTNWPEPYNIFFDRLPPLVPRELRFDVPERVGADGCSRPAARRGGARRHRRATARRRHRGGRRVLPPLVRESRP